MRTVVCNKCLSYLLQLTNTLSLDKTVFSDSMLLIIDIDKWKMRKSSGGKSKTSKTRSGMNTISGKQPPGTVIDSLEDCLNLE